MGDLIDMARKFRHEQMINAATRKAKAEAKERLKEADALISYARLCGKLESKPSYLKED